MTIWPDGFDGPRNDEFGTFHRVLTPDIVPPPDAPFWMDIAEFALTFDGYATLGNELGGLANKAATRYRETGQLPDSLVRLRSYLFYEQRRWRHLDATPEGSDLDYIRALVEAIRAWAETGTARSER